jgi:hypothetical protein
MEQANYSAFNKWKKVWMVGFPEIKASVQYLGAEQFRTGSRWSPALGDSGGISIWRHS